jgi:hypothetical protein
MASAITWPNGSVHSPLDQFFFNFSEPAMARFWNDTALFGTHGFASPHVDGFFIDDDAFGREHPTLQKDCGMSDAAVVDFADKQHAALVASFESVVAGGGMVWDAMRDPDGREARAWGAAVNPSATNCSAWMADKCERDYTDHTLLMTPHCSQRTGLCDETNASAAAFMLLRGPHAFWGGGFWWGNNAVTQPSLFDERIGNLDPGIPLGSCVASTDGQTFSRTYSKVTVHLDCSTFQGRFDAVEVEKTLRLKMDDGDLGVQAIRNHVDRHRDRGTRESASLADHGSTTSGCGVQGSSSSISFAISTVTTGECTVLGVGQITCARTDAPPPHTHTRTHTRLSWLEASTGMNHQHASRVCIFS